MTPSEILEELDGVLFEVERALVSHGASPTDASEQFTFAALVSRRLTDLDLIARRAQRRLLDAQFGTAA